MATLCVDFVFLRSIFDKFNTNPQKTRVFFKEQVGTVVRNTSVGVHKITTKTLQGDDKFNILLCLERKVFSQEELQAVGLLP